MANKVLGVAETSCCNCGTAQTVANNVSSDISAIKSNPYIWIAVVVIIILIVLGIFLKK